MPWRATGGEADDYHIHVGGQSKIIVEWAPRGGCGGIEQGVLTLFARLMLMWAGIIFLELDGVFAHLDGAMGLSTEEAIIVFLKLTPEAISSVAAVQTHNLSSACRHTYHCCCSTQP